MSPITITIIVLVATIILFMSGKFPFALPAAAACVVLYLTGVLDAAQAFSGFHNTNVILIFAMMIVTGGLNRTSFASSVTKFVYRFGKNEWSIIICLYLIVGILAQFMNAVVALSILMPIMYSMCDELKISPSRIIFPVTIGALSWVGWFPVANGASAYGRYNGFLETLGATERLGIWNLWFGRLPAVILCTVFMLIWGWKLAPKTPSVPIQEAKGRQQNKTPLPAWKEKLAYTIFALTTIGMLTSSLTGLDAWVVASLGAIFMCAFKILSDKEAFGSVNWNVIFLTAGSLGVAEALSATGAAELVGDWMLTAMGGVTNPYAIGAIFFIVPFILTQFMSNTAVDNVFTPLAIMVCMSLEINPVGVLCILRVAGSCSYFTPMASPAIAYVTPAGGYTIKDLVKMSFIPSAILGVVVVLFSMTVFPA